MVSDKSYVAVMTLLVASLFFFNAGFTGSICKLKGLIGVSVDVGNVSAVTG